MYSSKFFYLFIQGLYYYTTNSNACTVITNLGWINKKRWMNKFSTCRKALFTFQTIFFWLQYSFEYDDWILQWHPGICTGRHPIYVTYNHRKIFLLIGNILERKKKPSVRITVKIYCNKYGIELFCQNNVEREKMMYLLTK